MLCDTVIGVCLSPIKCFVWEMLLVHWRRFGNLIILVWEREDPSTRFCISEYLPRYYLTWLESRPSLCNLQNFLTLFFDRILLVCWTPNFISYFLTCSSSSDHSPGNTDEFDSSRALRSLVSISNLYMIALESSLLVDRWLWKDGLWTKFASVTLHPAIHSSVLQYAKLIMA